MANMIPLIKSGGFFASRYWTPLVIGNGLTTTGGDTPDPPVQKTVSGSIVTINDALAAPAVDLSVAINPVQSGTGDPSPDNVRPITGWTGANVTRTGKNLLGGEDFADAILETMPTATVDTENGTVTFAGNTVDGNSKIISGGVKFKENTQYTFLFSFTGERRNVRWWYTDGTYDASSDVPTSGVYRSDSGKTVHSLRKMRYNNSTVTLNYNNCGIFEGSLSATDFEAYSGTTYTVSFGAAGTVYGGTLDVVNGTLTVDRVCHTLNNETWTLQSASSVNPRRFSKSLSALGWETPASTRVALSSHFTAAGYSKTATFGHMDVSNTYMLFSDNDSAFASSTDFRTWVHGQYENGTPVQVSYKIATPTTVALTPTEVQMLLGTNNVWSDTNGDITLTYLADGNVSASSALNMLLGGTYTPSADVTDREALNIIMGDTT